VVVVVSLTFGVDENCVLSANTPVRSLVWHLICNIIVTYQ
jgi:hypothetical protein